MPHVPESIGPTKEPAEGSRETVDESLDRNTSDRPDKGERDSGRTDRSKGKDVPPSHPQDAASGRLAPDPVDAMNQRDPLTPPRGDTSRK